MAYFQRYLAAEAHPLKITQLSTAIPWAPKINLLPAVISWPLKIISSGYFHRNRRKSCSRQNYFWPISDDLCLVAENITTLFSVVSI
jgi:hypothetical protein